ncbi:hypothetical protein [Deinococcus peraridilitoris]|uniref:Sodium:proline symporter n=1 Tax=Deinococcus peraridilitoris (strain DSM 19664 / LMG 22246 / CIP 109416 / KR-200) TaxID=937777 RepID=L0A623_DEIPD|nr:hypothetical protein [Deinococcus peraridilitoris]AFZ69301.1 hypothetical protein Deipe_3886 [Deinococcus peraridilitoris DSM 19664]
MERHQTTSGLKLNVKAAVIAGLIAGAIFMVLEMLLVATVGGGSAWGPPRMIAAIALGQGVLPPPATFDFGIVMTAMGVHFLLSVVFALVLAWVIERMSAGAALLVGAVFGLLLYLVNFYGMTAVFPWFAMARNWISIFSHVVFGVIAAWAYQSSLRRNSY